MRFFALTFISSLFLLVLIIPADAQSEDCFSLVSQAVAETLAVCQAQAIGEVCHGSGEINSTPNALTTLGDRLSINQVDGIILEDDNTVSIASIRLPNISLDEENPSATALFLFGDATFNRDVSSNLPAWQAFTIADSGTVCRNAERPAGALLQASDNTRIALRVNNVDISFNKTLFLTLDENRLQVSVLEGDAVIEAANADSVALFAGFQWTEGQSSPPLQYDYNVASTLPVNLLPRIPRIALPGQVTLATETALFEQTHTNSPIVTELLPGTLLNVYGSDLSGEWRHVREPGGESGWIPAETLQNQLDTTLPAYEATPQLMTRPFGPAWGRGGTGFGQINLRIGPSEDDGILARLPANVEFSVLGRSADLEWIFIQLDEPIDSLDEGWVFVPVIDLEPDLRLGELPLVP